MSYKHLYFAYGSNLSEAQISERCPSARRLDCALLEDHRLAFVGRGVATVLPSADASVPGVIWEIDGDDLNMLDLYEGLGSVYDRYPLWVETAGGEAVWVEVYLHSSGLERAPSLSYLNRIRTGYDEAGFDHLPIENALESAEGGSPMYTVNRPLKHGERRNVFVYGTLMKGFGNHGLLAGSDFVGSARLATEDYRMVDLGCFPGLTSHGLPDGMYRVVHGEVYSVDADVLRGLDALEGVSSGFYKRVPVVLGWGLEADTYVLCQDEPSAVEVKVGDWRAYTARDRRWSADVDRWLRLESGGSDA